MKEGYKKTTIGYIPFEWRLMQIGEVMEFSGGAQPPKEYFINEPREGYIRLIQIRDYKTNEYITYIPIDKARKICNKNDIMIGRYGPPIFQILEGLEGAYNVALIKAIPDENMLNKEYARIFLKTEKLFKLIDRLSQRTSGQTGIDMDALNNYLIPIPSLKEQQKIADIISTVDLQICDTDKIIEKTKELKKGLMQRLLTKGIGHKEFKMSEVGEIPMEWNVVKIEDVCKIVDYRGKTPSKVEKGVFLVTAKNIGKGFIDYELSKEYIREEDYGIVMSRGIPAVGDVVFTTEAPLGNVANVDRKDIALAQRVIKFRGNKEILNNFYLKYYMLGDIFQGNILNEATGSTVLGIKGSRLKKIELAIPSLEEQEKIVNILSSVDSEIEEYKNKKTRLVELKKGLMQQLLSGKIRVLRF